VKILITGSSGQLGRSLVAALCHHKIEATTRDRLDITLLVQVREAVRAFTPDLVANAAAYNDVDAAEANVLTAYRHNAQGPRNLALVTAEAGIPLLHVSTDYVFDGTANRPYHEYDLPSPLSVYAASKLAGEIAVRSLNRRHYLVRTSWLFHETGQNFLNTMRSLRGQPRIKAVNDQFGSPTYAPHLASAISDLIETAAYGVYHMSGQGGASHFELTRTLFSMLGLKTDILPVSHAEFPAPAVRPRNTVLTTIQEPRILLPPWQEGIEAFVRVLR
jgi:dTDP-4-dehydrorhamnose reductase